MEDVSLPILRLKSAYLTEKMMIGVMPAKKVSASFQERIRQIIMAAMIETPALTNMETLVDSES